MYGLLPPALTPEQVYDINSDLRYTRWETSREGVNFFKLRRATSALDAEKNTLDKCYAVLLSSRGKRHTAAEIDAAVQETRQLVARHTAALVMMRDTVRYDFSLPPGRSVDEDTSYLSDFRNLVWLNSLDAELKRRDGNNDGAAYTLVYGMEFGQHLMTGSNFIGRLVGTTCQSISARPLWKVLPDVSPAAYPRFLGHLQDASVVPAFSDAVSEEKRLGQRLMLQLFNGKSLGEKLRSPSVLTVSTLVWSQRATFTDYTAYHDAIADLSTRPYQRGEPKPSVPSDLLNRILFNDLSTIRFKDVEVRADNALLLQAAAVYAFRAKTGHFPETLEGTRKAFPPRFCCFGPCKRLELPTDPFGQDKPLLYRRTGNTFLLYSVGPDGRDDGGKEVVRVDANSTGDMVGGINF